MNPQLQALRDIHLPPPVSWWPLAPGWWVLAAMVVLIGFGVWWYLRIRRKAKRQDAWRREALNEMATLRSQLTTLPSQQLLTQLSILIRRVAITRLPRRDVAALHGERWLAFLDLSMGEGFRAAGGALLVSAPYLPSGEAAVLSVDSMQKLFTIVEGWIKRLPKEMEHEALPAAAPKQKSMRQSL